MENTDELKYGADRAVWFVALGERWLGPFRVSEVLEKIQSGELSWIHYVWKEGQKEWERICDVREFQGPAPVQPSASAVDQIKNSLKPKVKPAEARRSRVPGAPVPPPAPDEGAEIADAEWFLFYNHSQFGPFSASEVMRLLSVGKITPRVHAWRDGMVQWTRLDEIDVFKGVKTAPGASSSKKEAADQRSAPRRPLVARIMVANEDSVIVGVCRDISVGGMQVLTDRVPGPVGSHIRLNVSPSGTESERAETIAPFVAQGLIVRILEDGRGFSFRFDQLPDDSRRAIERYIEKYA